MNPVKDEQMLTTNIQRSFFSTFPTWRLLKNHFIHFRFLDKHNKLYFSGFGGKTLTMVCDKTMVLGQFIKIFLGLLHWKVYSLSFHFAGHSVFRVIVNPFSTAGTFDDFCSCFISSVLLSVKFHPKSSATRALRNFCPPPQVRHVSLFARFFFQTAP